ncbi:hypothetical protein O3M35_012139 [Rhynocoris fuscipes]
MNAALLYFLCCLIGCTQASIEYYRDCGRKDYCQNRSSEYLFAPQNLDIDKFFNSQCYCDKECVKYGDCCIDRTKWPEENYYIDHIPRSLWTCTPLGNELGIYLVDGCLEESDVSNLCARKPINKDYHYTLDLPVYSAKTGIYYANVFCAICHKDTKKLKAIKTVLECTGSQISLEKLREEGEYLPGLRTWKAGNETCKMIPHDVTLAKHYGRRCIPSIADCPQTWDDFAVRDKCYSYQQLVKDNSSVFKNPHCALCNGIQPSELHCWQMFDYKVPLKHPSLFMIFDFNWDPNSCPIPKSVWDSLNGVCREMPCKDSSCIVNDCDKNYLNNNNSNSSDNCDDEEKEDQSEMLILTIEGYLTVVCLTISIVCLTIHNIVFYTLPKQRNLPGKILTSLSWSLIMAQTIFLIGVSPIINVPNFVCKSIAIIIHFYFLSAFFWMNVMSIDIWRTFSKSAFSNCHERTHTKYALYAWGCPALITCFALIADLTEFLPKDFRPYYGVYPGVCWFANRIGLGIYFYVPICILLCTNAILFTITVCWLQKQTNNAELIEASGRKEYTRLWLYVKLSIIMGLSWAFGMIAAFAHRPKFWYPFIILNGLQGAFIFLMFDLKTNVITSFFEKIGLKQYLRDGSKRNKTDTQSSKLSTSLRRSSGTKV